MVNMREIKFRAWDGKQFVKPSNSKKHGVCIFSGDLFDCFVDTNSGISWKDHYKLQQYTGLKDKNGTEIYEGDKLITVSENGKDIGSEKLVHFTDGAFFIDDRRCYGTIVSFMRICGNIYENTELLNSTI